MKRLLLATAITLASTAAMAAPADQPEDSIHVQDPRLAEENAAAASEPAPQLDKHDAMESSAAPAHEQAAAPVKKTHTATKAKKPAKHKKTATKAKSKKHQPAHKATKAKHPAAKKHTAAPKAAVVPPEEPAAPAATPAAPGASIQ